MLSLWVILALSLAAISAAGNIVEKFIISKEVKDPFVATTVTGFLALIVYTIVSLVFGNISLPTNVIFLSILGGIVANIGIFFYFKALEQDEASHAITPMATQPLFVLLFALLFLNEQLATKHYLGIFLLVGGSIAISLKKKKHHLMLRKVLLFAVIYALLSAARNVILKSTTSTAGVVSILFWFGLGAGLVSLTFLAIHHPHLKKKVGKGIKHIIIVNSLALAVALLYVYTISTGPVSLVSGLVYTKPVFVFLFASIISKFHPKAMKETLSHHSVLQKTIGIALVVIGGILLI